MRNLFVLESIFLDNATYVFGSDRETISQLSKAEIISGGFQKDRIAHDRRWKYKAGPVGRLSRRKVHQRQVDYD